MDIDKHIDKHKSAHTFAHFGDIINCNKSKEIKRLKLCPFTFSSQVHVHDRFCQSIEWQHALSTFFLNADSRLAKPNSYHICAVSASVL